MARQRGKDQLGTLGSGNHFLEVQVIDQIFDEAVAEAWDLKKGQVTVMIHSGSRGLGYQVCDDSLKTMNKAFPKYGIQIPDRQLVCVPVHSREGQDYLKAMRCAANFAWANRQCLMHQARKSFSDIFGKNSRDLGMSLIYDVAHNIAKFEDHDVKGRKMKLCVHRKGATRAFPPGHSELPEEYQKTGQPVIIPGDMGRNSYLLVGADGSMKETFGSTCHGAGRLLSRKGAQRDERSHSLLEDLRKKGIVVKARGKQTLAEEAPYAYKDVNDVVEVVHQAGLSKKVCRMRPMGVVKG
jgi:tRNA-splicing ligase RtcB